MIIDKSQIVGLIPSLHYFNQITGTKPYSVGLNCYVYTNVFHGLDSGEILHISGFDKYVFKIEYTIIGLLDINLCLNDKELGYPRLTKLSSEWDLFMEEYFPDLVQVTQRGYNYNLYLSEYSLIRQMYFDCHLYEGVKPPLTSNSEVANKFFHMLQKHSGDLMYMDCKIMRSIDGEVGFRVSSNPYGFGATNSEWLHGYLRKNANDDEINPDFENLGELYERLKESGLSDKIVAISCKHGEVLQEGFPPLKTIEELLQKYEIIEVYTKLTILEILFSLNISLDKINDMKNKLNSPLFNLAYSLYIKHIATINSIEI